MSTHFCYLEYAKAENQDYAENTLFTLYLKFFFCQEYN